eukprot:CAMPEP_0181383126 /NCGR_PEP_ID=MMETSP1106-20121128/21168_1 /TAXON_ID=81844 /ORGANISM="Mantoniella antarctica, Strain SL-175" /LENGTH=70 /DNA_ID=CAMNT_0023502715 /DNA_START=226 /DNA_END=439 /DNA_ORIENTATION=+
MGVERRLHGHVDVDVEPPEHVDLRFAGAPPATAAPPGAATAVVAAVTCAVAADIVAAVVRARIMETSMDQ